MISSVSLTLLILSYLFPDFVVQFNVFFLRFCHGILWFCVCAHYIMLVFSECQCLNLRITVSEALSRVSVDILQLFCQSLEIVA